MRDMPLIDGTHCVSMYIYIYIYIYMNIYICMYM